ncbi:microsomal signal peptidase protein, putative [Plasmodium sp. DRC-Itaito]|nr:microsomal signal peptidase protein, putative [Plasmodium sp. DRC-Itaito]
MNVIKYIISIIKHTCVCLKSNQMDYCGQNLAYTIRNIIFGISTIISIIVGYYNQSLELSTYIILAGTALASILILPTWPMYNRNNIEWEKSNNSTNDKKSK